MNEPNGAKRILYRFFSSGYGLPLLFVVSFLYFLIGITQIVDVYDEGIPVYGAERVLNGEIPYRDFWTLYAPGQFYLLAGWFKIFGSSILAERVYGAIFKTLTSIAFFLLASRLASRGWSLAFWLVVTIWLKFFGYYASVSFPALFFVLASFYVLFGFFDRDKPKIRLFIAGLLTGLAGLFRHDFGFYLFLSELLTVYPFAFFHFIPKNGAEGSLKRIAKLLPFAWPHLLGVALPLLPVGLYFASVVPPGELMYDLVVFPSKIFPVVRDTSYPASIPDVFALIRGEVALFGYLAEFSKRLAFYFPWMAFTAAIILFVSKKRQKQQNSGLLKPAPAWKWGAGLLFVFGVLSFNNVRIRSDLPHLLPSFVCASLVLAVLISRILELRLFRRGPVFGFGLAAAFVLLIYPVYELQKPGMDERFRPLLYSHNLERAKGVGVNPYQADAIHYIQSVTFPWEKIFVGNNRHDLIYNNDIMFYFLSGRHSATKYHELFPGLATSRAVQAKIVEDLQRNNVRYLVLLSRFQNPGVTTEPVPVRLLDDFIAQNFQPVEKFGDWSVWERKFGN